MGKKSKRGAEADAIETGALNAGEAVAVDAAFEAEPYEGLSIVEVDELEAIDLEGIETPLADDDEAALEAGIASVFDTILAEGFETSADEAAESLGGYDGEDEELAHGDADEGAADADAELEPTVALLAELNRLWAQPLAA